MPGGDARAPIETRQAIPFSRKIALGTVDDGAAIVKRSLRFESRLTAAVQVLLAQPANLSARE